MGGNLFKEKCEPIILKDVVTVVPEIIEKIKKEFPEKIILPVGSAGFKETSSDIDIAVECSSIDDLKDIIKASFDADLYTMESFYIVAIPFKYKSSDGNEKYVSVDFIQMRNPIYTHFRYKSPNYLKDESKYKVGTKIMMVGDLLRLSPACQKDLPTNCSAWMDYSPIGLYQNFFNKKDISCYVRRFLTDEPQEIVNLIIKEGGQLCDFDTVESIWKAIHEKPLTGGEKMLKDFELSFFVNCYRKSWEAQVNPKDFDIRYWTLDEIYKEMEKQIPVRQANKLLDSIQA